nr:MAG TPA: vesicle-associated membrane protein 2 [Caudoviricetes sp.]
MDVEANNLSSLKENIDRLIKKQKNIDTKADEAEGDVKSAIKNEGQTRNQLTLYFIAGFFGILVFCCLFVLFYNWLAVHWIIDLKSNGFDSDLAKVPFIELDKLLSIMIGAFGTSLGFIIGYYFKDKK